MKVKVQAVVVRHKDTQELLDLPSIINNLYCETLVVYPAGLITIEEIKEYATQIYGDRAEKLMADTISKVAFGKEFCIQCEAKDLPSIGKVQVCMETKEIEWE